MRKYLVLGSIIGVLAGPFLAIEGNTNAGRIAKLAAEGKTAQGTVTGGEQKSGGRRRSGKNDLEVKWAPTGQTERTQTFAVKKDFWNKIRETGIGTPVTVKFLEADPWESAIIEGGTNLFPESILPGIGITVAGLAAGAAWFLTRQRS